MNFPIKIDHTETGKQCANISSALVLGILIQFFFEPEKVRLLFSTLGFLSGIGWYVLAQYCFTRSKEK
ncbi:hypothetical protein GWO43_28525 [candidate division KSB1 bacterium]|nr:hypothetical protein [candidate division KSB1 bacterium]NIX74415.1 hypothetical protein [candidate division KSB1 bacterium]